MRVRAYVVRVWGETPFRRTSIWTLDRPRPLSHGGPDGGGKAKEGSARRPGRAVLHQTRPVIPGESILTPPHTLSLSLLLPPTNPQTDRPTSQPALPVATLTYRLLLQPRTAEAETTGWLSPRFLCHGEFFLLHPSEPQHGWSPYPRRMSYISHSPMHGCSVRRWSYLSTSAPPSPRLAGARSAASKHQSVSSAAQLVGTRVCIYTHTGPVYSLPMVLALTMSIAHCEIPTLSPARQPGVVSPNGRRSVSGRYRGRNTSAEVCRSA